MAPLTHAGMGSAGHDERIGQVLGELQAVAGPGTWPEIERLLGTLLELHGAAVERLVDDALGAVADLARLDERQRAAALVAGLISLLGMQPCSLEAHVLQALAYSPHNAAFAAVGLEVVSVVPALAVLRVRRAPCDGEVMQLVRAANRAVRQAIPEIGKVLIEGLPPRGHCGTS